MNIVGMSLDKDRKIDCWIYSGDNINRFSEYILFTEALAKIICIKFKNKSYKYIGKNFITLDVSDFNNYFVEEKLIVADTTLSILMNKVDILEQENADLLLAIAKRDMILDNLETDVADILLELATKKGSA